MLLAELLVQEIHLILDELNAVFGIVEWRGLPHLHGGRRCHAALLIHVLLDNADDCSRSSATGVSRRRNLFIFEL